ncbi:MAG: hypothetical protein A3G52_03765 [Candidatus Taylorbacteria bacterium RIFCSPLOWO2_12_FULL_43_20]|uniref:Nudix hydrolase domain-containing protein n=1 Tax=Candidatus Taylorbacteria bacterium RIFCSPLOWO2_12_FULL_43_20 TaxID=1802332 RepID=A0A1G2P1S0_9BACT|nr:MAG: hypothetical protein A2825_00685 [Candidatus Taylorbacteria bacterium RIFCSPHIGHO2_01_FULL_43_120]OHA22863.1 MAG: hypothetical protein A3B98_01560 [Candidatus Taylorbacteria bacterium RIFCSPHIGHO2_02_FULL_43_55]OHA29354.1 MAG: hypothetical protein A3E92_02335 [Candidatus Taylorbacteria bacterium RIFCSPHIGHO2_12_FULL_42_34]OHA31731.1 MAG: hypothetical protein A3B09_01780 [Candidatus Taylorbacteria bacterium RIFCSPLOWO2_01_FULL_43_83]OHA38782.1 MAG: hypothetical protein A3H58_01890 [Candi
MILQVGVKVFLGNKHGQYLLLYRSLEKYPDVKGRWDIVGGRIVPGSKLKENLRREVKEETGLEIISEPVLIAAQDIMPDGDKHVVRLTYTAETEGEPVLNTSENTDYKWMLKEEIEALDDLDIYAKDALKAISHPIKV